MKKANKSILVYCICCVLLIASPFLSKRWNNVGSQAVIVWDIYGYYLYLPSLFYDDLGKLNNYDYIHNTYHPSDDNKDQAFVVPTTGKYVMNYPCGMAIIALPAFTVGHCWAKIGGYKVDGFSYPYQISYAFWCVIISCIGLWFIRLLLLRYFDDWLGAVILFILCFATNYYEFASLAPLTHTYLFTLYALILWLTDSFYRKPIPSLRFVAIIGWLCGLATITRPTEIICAMIPLLWAIGDTNDAKERIAFLWKNKSVAITFVLFAAIAALPQLIYWQVFAGHWLFYSYHGDDKTFSFLHPHIMDVLFSYKKGWFMYTPVMILSVLGFYPLFKKNKKLFYVTILFSVINLYLVSSWDIWWYGGSFSMRALVQSYPLLLFPLGAFINWAVTSKWTKWATVIFLTFCTWLNLVMHYQANGGAIINGDNETRAYYWHTFGKLSITERDKRYLDTDEVLPQDLEKDLKTIYENGFEQLATAEKAIVHSGNQAIQLDKEHQNMLTIAINADSNVAWYRVYAYAYFPVKEYSTWGQSQLIISLVQNGKKVKSKMIRVQAYAKPREWAQVYVDIKLPSKPVDFLYIDCWNNNEKILYLDDIRVAAIGK